MITLVDYKNNLGGSGNGEREKLGNSSESSRPIAEIFNYLRVQKTWNPSGKINIKEIYRNVDTSRPTLYSCLEALQEMNLIELEGFGDKSRQTFVLINPGVLSSVEDGNS